MGEGLIRNIYIDRRSPRHHLRGFVLLAAGQALAGAMTFVAVTYPARALGIEMFGVIGFAAAVAAYFLLLVDAGLDLIAMLEIASQESSVESVVANVFAFVLLTPLSCS